MGIHPVLESLAKQEGLHWQVWYLDDGLLIGDPAQVCRAFDSLVSGFRAIGLAVNPSKCELWGPGQAQWTGPDTVKRVPWDPSGGITVLGTPVNYPGGSACSDAYWGKVTESLQGAIEKVTQVTDLQCAHHLLRKCLDACKVNHLLRSTDSYASDGALHICDEIIL